MSGVTLKGNQKRGHELEQTQVNLGKEASGVCVAIHMSERVGLAGRGQRLLWDSHEIMPPELYVHCSFTQVREPASYLIPQFSMFLKQNLINK